MSTEDTGPAKRTVAGAFDVRNVIAALIGFYGIVLVVVGLVDNGEEALRKTDGVNANLWLGDRARRRRRRVRPVDPAAADRRGGERGGEVLTQRVVVVALLAA